MADATAVCRRRDRVVRRPRHLCEARRDTAAGRTDDRTAVGPAAGDSATAPDEQSLAEQAEAARAAEPEIVTVGDEDAEAPEPDDKPRDGA